jgi:Mrp family chromosome partitioning ATPase
LNSPVAEVLRPHSHPTETSILFDDSREEALQGASAFVIEGYNNVWLADRLATEGDWAHIERESQGAPRVVFFSIKGGVGRSTALAATAWAFAQAGKRVLVLDLDLESPGLSSSLLPDERRPQYGITDWLVEDLVDNAEAVFQDLRAPSDLSHDGEIYVVPAHGADPGDYVAKLARVWMPKIAADGSRQKWSARLRRLIDDLERRMEPDIILIDSRAGIDEVASACVTELGAKLILLFALEGSQTWTGYRILFEHWLRHGAANDIRESLQIVGALLPETGRDEYVRGLQDCAYDLFAGTLYDDIPAGEIIGDRFHFEATDESAPHCPWGIKWYRSFAGIRSLHGRLSEIDVDEVRSIFGPVIKGIAESLGMEDVDV